MGTLYCGDDLDILRRYLKDETVDLVCLEPPAWPQPLRRGGDPPLNSAQNYNAVFHEKDGTDAAIEETFKKAPASRKKHSHQMELEM